MSAVTCHDFDSPSADVGEMSLSAVREVCLELDADNAADGSDQDGEERRVVSSAGADLKYPVAVRHLKVLQHRCHDRWL